MTQLPFHLFLDLDGVLADFDRRVQEIFGKSPNEIPAGRMWSRLANPELDFYNSLEWMPDGKELFEATRHYNPTILTGLPMGKWAEPQKRAWCARELGSDVKVITCMARDKHTFARPSDVLIDDRVKAHSEWTRVGGVFILHTSTKNSLAELNAYIESFNIEVV